MKDVLGFKRGDKIYFHQVGSIKKPGRFIRYDGYGAIIKEVGRLNSQGYALTKPFLINSTLIEPREERVKRYTVQGKSDVRNTYPSGTEKLMAGEW